MINERSKTVISFALAGLCAALWTEILLYSQNTLYLNDQWIVSKGLQPLPLTGFPEFLVTRSPLAGNRLHLNLWGSHQEVVSRKAGPLRSVRFRYKVSRGSYLAFTFNRSTSPYDGFFLSDGDGQGAVFREESGGRFLSRTPIPTPGLKPGWHEAYVTSGPTGLRLTIDRTDVATLPGLPFSGPISFKGGGSQSEVDDLLIQSTSGDAWTESFENRKGWSFAFLSCALLLLLIAAPFRGRFCAALAAASTIGLASGAVWLPFDFFYWSHRDTRDPMRAAGFALDWDKTRINYPEIARFRLFDSWSRALFQEGISPEGVFKKGYPRLVRRSSPAFCGTDGRCAVFDPSGKPWGPRRYGEHRIVFVGTSQTVGMGSTSLEETHFARIHRSLLQAFPGGLESLNASVSGWTAPELFKIYQERYLSFEPDLMVIVLSRNDSAESLEKGVTDFLRLNETAGVRTVVVPEPTSIAIQEVERNRERLRELAKRFGADVLPLAEYLTSPKTGATGFLWCDDVHLSTYGQSLAAEWLAPPLLKELQATHRR